MRSSRHRHQAKRLLTNIARAPKSKLRGAIRDYLNSHSAKVDAVTEAALKKRIKLSKSDVQLIAQDLDVWKPCVERVWLNPELKEGPVAGFRWILSFGLENSARQILVRNALAARGGIAPTQTLFHGGRDEAIRRVKENYQAGYQHSFEIDVQRCFRSWSWSSPGFVDGYGLRDSSPLEAVLS